MVSKYRIAGVVLVVLGLGVLGATCAPAPSDDGGGTTDQGGGIDTSQLTTDEMNAVATAANVAGGFEQASMSTQQAVGTADQTGHRLPSQLGGLLDDLLGQTGTCPVVTRTAGEGVTLLSVTVDFGSGCTTDYPTTYQYSCSGSATGSYDVLSHTVSLTFAPLACGQSSLAGAATVSASFDALAGRAVLEGEWNLDWTYQSDVTHTEGNGTCWYTLSTLTTEIPQFTGSITAAGEELWQCTIADVALSYVTYASYIPYSGTITLDGESIRLIVVRFNENSPIDGNIEVSIDGAPFFTVNLAALEALL